MTFVLLKQDDKYTYISEISGLNYVDDLWKYRYAKYLQDSPQYCRIFCINLISN